MSANYILNNVLGALRVKLLFENFAILSNEFYVLEMSQISAYLEIM